MVRFLLWVVLMSARMSALDGELLKKAVNIELSPGGSDLFLNTGQQMKKGRETNVNLENSVIKSKLEVLGELFKEHVLHLRTTGNKQVELVFLVDASASVGVENFHSELKFVKKLLADFTVSEDTTRVAVITFASKNQVIRHVDHISQPSQGNHKCGLLHRELPSVGYTGGGTFTRGALLEAQEVLKYGRPSASKAVFLITDGFSNGGDPTPVAARLKQSGVRIFTFGVAHGNTRELHDVASSPGRKHSFILDSFGEFEALVRRALHEDLKAGSYQLLDSEAECSHLCANRTTCCDEHAHCACGVDTGHFACLCPSGFFGSGLQGSCHACPNGTYSDEWAPGDLTQCKPCPDPNHVTVQAATSRDHCVCNNGFRARGDRCQVITCPRLSPPPKGFFVKRTCSNVLHAACGVRCAIGYHLVGSSIRLCQENGTWSGEPAHCKVKTCDALTAPDNGNVTCSRADLAVDTECTFTCSPGSHLVGSKHRTCLPLGRWDGLTSACKAVTCPALPRLQQGSISPGDCATTKQAHGVTCRLTCDQGFRLQGPGSRTCGSRPGTWSGTRAHARCVDETPPSLECPPDLEVTTDADEKFATVTWAPPDVIDNSGQPPNVWTKPATKLPMSVKIGVTQIQYVAMDASRNKARCTFSVTVRDLQPPRVDSCDDPPTFLTSSADTALQWDPPAFTDNSGKPVKVSRSPNTDVFGYGTTQVTYVASDKYDNNSTCVMNITVQENVCLRPAAPDHGQLDCTLLSDALHCTLTCEEGYAFAIAPRDYFCTYDDNGTVLAPDASVDPVPDCSVNVLPNLVSQEGTVTMEGEGGVCSEMDVLALVKQEMEGRLRAVVAQECDSGVTCDLDDTTLSCDEILSLLEEADNSVGRRRRDTPGPRSRIDLHFRVTGDGPSSGLARVRTSLDRLTAQEVTKKRGVKVKRIGFRPEPRLGCPAGSVLRGKMCVRCPVGTRMSSTSRACESCPVGQFQDQEGRLECVTCPPGTSTRRIHARHVQECKPLCPPGTYGRHRKLSPAMLGLAPCTTCPLGYFQPLSGQLGCQPCTEGQTTLRRGAVSRDQCKAPCGPGESSATGHAPCRRGEPNPCPCQHGGSCEGSELGDFLCGCPPAYVGSLCEVELNHCSSSPCLHGASCLPLVTANFTCLCAQGYTGHYCEVDEDECRSAPCLHGGTCVDLVGAFHCLCAEGYNGTTCELDMDECAMGPCGDHGACSDGVANYTCECSVGFTGSHCEVESADPCAFEPCLFGATCTTLNDTYRCACAPGYAGVDCAEEDACAAAPCAHGGSCLRVPAGFFCACVPGFAGGRCETQLPSDFSLEFPVAGTTDYVAVRGPSQPLAQVSVCLWLKTSDLFNYGTVFSYATDHSDNSFTLTDYNGFVLYVNGDRIITDVIANDGVWHFLCSVWQSADGGWAIYIDGKLGDRGRGLAVGSRIPANGSLVLGQEQDRLGGGFSQSEAFMGRLSSVAMWDRVVDLLEVREMATSCDAEYRGNIFQWLDFLAGIRGDLKVEKSTFCSGCPELRAPYNGYVAMAEDGRRAVYSCKPGYHLRWRDDTFASVFNRTCMKQGEWEGEMPACTRVSCGFPGYFPGGLVLGRSYRFNDTVTYVCLADRDLVGDSLRVCTESGQWSGRVPVCAGKSCPLLDAPRNGRVVRYLESEDGRMLNSSVQPQPGHQMEFECDEGFLLEGPDLATCLESDQWDERPPSCVPVQCRLRDTLPHGSIARTPRGHENAVDPPEFDLFLAGDTIEMRCDAGFALVGISSSTCLASGLWSYANASCVRSCDPDQIPFYSQFFATRDDFRVEIFENDIGNGVLEVTGSLAGDVASFKCREGFELRAASSLQWVCSTDGRWDPLGNPQPELLNSLETICQPIDANCSKPVVPDNSYILQELGELSPMGTTVHFTCRQGYLLEGPSQAVCQYNGSWSADNVTTCRAVECRRPVVPPFTVHVALPATPIYGHMVTFKCVEGFSSYGELSSRCQANGRWSRVRGKCSRVACGKPTVSGGAILNGVSYLFEDKVTFHCPPGTKPKGTPVLTCLKTGLWSDSAICV